MLPSPTLYYALLAVCAAALVVRCARVDRVLAAIVIASLCVNVTGAAAMDWWARHKHGREYTAGDEVGYQWEGAKLLGSWRTGIPFQRATVGAYAPVNAVVIAIAGPGQTPMRVVTGVVGAAGVAAVYWLAVLLYRRRTTAQLAAFLAMTSPILILYSWANLRDRWIGAAAVLAIVAIVKVLDRWSWRTLLALFATLVALGALRHYWAVLLGWLALPAFLALSRAGWRRRALQGTAVFLVAGTALWVVTGSFFAAASRQETAVRYVTVTPQTVGRTTPEVTAAGGAERPPFSGDTLGRAEAATRPSSVGEILTNLRFVLFGRVTARPDGGQYASKLLLPESLWSYALLPLAVAGLFVALAAGRTAALVPAAYIGAVIAILTWLRGDDWNTYRFRGLYWSVLIVFAAAGIVWLADRIRARQVTRQQRTAAV